MKMFITLLILIICIMSFPYGWDRKMDNFEWHIHKGISLVKKTTPYIENGLEKLFTTDKKTTDDDF